MVLRSVLSDCCTLDRYLQLYKMIPRTLQHIGRTLMRPSLSSSISKPVVPIFNYSTLMYSSETSLYSISKYDHQETVVDAAEEKKLAEDVISEVNKQLERNEEGRLFAVIHISGRQIKVTQDDIIIVDNNSFAPLTGDKIKFEKVMLIGGADFTLVGRPLLSSSLVNVAGTIIEKDLSHTRTNFRKIPRKRHMRFRFYRTQLTMVRINEVQILGKVGHREDVEGIDKLIK